MDKLAVYAYGNLAVFLVLVAAGVMEPATVLAIVSCSVFMARRVHEAIAHPVQN